MRSVPNIFPSVKFPNFGNVSCFSCFSFFFLEKKRGKSGQKCRPIRTALLEPHSRFGNKLLGITVLGITVELICPPKRDCGSKRVVNSAKCFERPSRPPPRWSRGYNLEYYQQRRSGSSNLVGGRLRILEKTKKTNKQQGESTAESA